MIARRPRPITVPRTGGALAVSPLRALRLNRRSDSGGFQGGSAEATAPAGQSGLRVATMWATSRSLPLTVEVPVAGGVRRLRKRLRR